MVPLQAVKGLTRLQGFGCSRERNVGEAEVVAPVLVLPALAQLLVAARRRRGALRLLRIQSGVRRAA